jgi:8-oxo-dGTP diphosphatase
MEKGVIVHTLIVNDKNEFLIIRRVATDDAWAGRWDLPGGTLEDGEDPAEGAKRETLEEVGLVMHNPSLFYYLANIDVKKNKQFFTLIFLAKYEGGIIDLSDGDHDEYAWITPENISKYPGVHYMEPCFKVVQEKSHALFELKK